MVEPSQLRHPTNQASLAYWQSQCGDRPMPARADLDPLDIPKLLPQVLLIDVNRTQHDFRYRVVGTRLADYMLADYTGKWMSEIEHQRPPSQVFSACETVVERREPIIGNVPYVGKYADYKTVEALIMPLSSDGETVDMLFVTVDFLT